MIKFSFLYKSHNFQSTEDTPLFSTEMFTEGSSRYPNQIKKTKCILRADVSDEMALSTDFERSDG